MKHLLNDLTEQEKNSIREQHTGGMVVPTAKFSKLVNTKSGDAKPLINEQPDVWSKYPCVKKMKDGLSPNGQKFKTDGKMQYYSNGRAMDPVTKKKYSYECGDGDEILTTLNEQESQPEVSEYLEKKVNELINEGYKVVDKISLPDGEYSLTGWGYNCYLNKDNKKTGYAYITRGGIRGSWAQGQNNIVDVVGGKIENRNVYKMLYNQSKAGQPSDKL